MIEYRPFPIPSIVASLTIIPQLLFMDIVFVVTIETLRRNGFIFACHMTFLAICLYMFPIQFKPDILRRVVVKERWFPTL